MANPVLHMGLKVRPVRDGKLLKNLAQEKTVPRVTTKNDGLVKECERCCGTE